MEKWLSVSAGFGLVMVAGINALIMFEVLTQHLPNSYRKAHRWLGWLVVCTFMIFFFYMLPRAAYFTAIYPHDIIHASLAFALFPVLVAKVLVVRRYTSYVGSLTTVGFFIFVALFVLIMLTGGYDVVKLLWGPPSGSHS